MSPPLPPARPFLKWAGGKTQLLGPIGRALPPVIEGRYLEPFLGGGAVFFHLRSEGRLRGGALLSDANRFLVEAYVAVRDETDALLDLLHDHREAHRADAAGHFYAVRDAAPDTAVERAARFLYLNKTCYNGLWRVNSGGKFNVPLGRYRNPAIFDEGNLRAAAAALRGVDIEHLPWTKALSRARRGSVVYMDPPYVPVSRTSNFTSYTADRFTAEDQEALARAAAALPGRGVRFLLSNSDDPDLRRLYRDHGLRVRSVTARRAINSSGTRRGPVGELLVDGGPVAETGAP